MANFPSLSVHPTDVLLEEFEDDTIRTSFEAGYVQTRPRYTQTKRIFTVNYRNMPKADRDLLTTFISTVREGAFLFNWTHPESGGSIYSVRFSELPKFTHIVRTFWDCSFKIRVA